MLTARVAAAVATVALVLAGHARAEAFRCSARGGPAWHEYRSKHFVVDSDASRADAARLVEDLERIQALEVKALVGEGVEIPGRVRVIALSDAAQYEALAHPGSADARLTVSALSEPTIVLTVEGSRDHPEDLAQQLAQHLSWHLFPRQQTWFRVGLASFVETLASETLLVPKGGADQTIHVREPAPERAAGLARQGLLEDLWGGPPLPARALLEWADDRGEGDSWPRRKAWSWLLYHWLWSHRPQQLGALQRRLAASEDPAAAWKAVFPDLDPADGGAMSRLERSLEQYRREGRYTFYTVSARWDATFREAPLPPADVHMLLLDVRRRWPEGEKAEALQRAEVDEALREDAAQPFAIVRKARLDGTSAVAPLRAAVAARPADVRAWVLLGEQLGPGEAADEKEAALRKAIALDPDGARAHKDLAWILANGPKAREALPLANRAVELAPWDASTVHTLAVVAMDLGHCKEAALLDDRAMAMWPPKDPAAERVHRRLAESEARCGAAAPAAR